MQKRPQAKGTTVDCKKFKTSAVNLERDLLKLLVQLLGRSFKVNFYIAVHF